MYIQIIGRNWIPNNTYNIDNPFKIKKIIDIFKIVVRLFFISLI